MEAMIEGKQISEMNVDVKFQRIWFGIVSTWQWLPHLAMLLILPNWANSQISDNNLPVTQQEVAAAIQAAVC